MEEAVDDGAAESTSHDPSTSTRTQPVEIPSHTQTTKEESASAPKIKQRSTSHTLANSNSASRKGPAADALNTEIYSNPPTLSMPPPSRPYVKSRTSSVYSHRTAGGLSDAWGHGEHRPSNDLAIEPDTPRITSGNMADDSARHSPLPDPAIRSKASMSDIGSKRMSVSSMYSLSSARQGGASSSIASNNGSESGMGSRATSGSISTPKGLGISQPETATSAVSITTSSSNPNFSNQVTTSSHQLTPRETVPHATTDAAKRPAAPRSEGTPRVNPPTRDRSRHAKRRFSGSTGQSSHSPSSDRGLLAKKEEGIGPHSWGVIGVCALDIKARSKPSRNILNKLIAKGEFEVVVFGDKVILDEEVENWPVCDFLISFYSDGFPLDKAIAYVKMRKPFCVNDVPMQKILWDRRICLRILDKINVSTPKRLEINRDGGPSILTPELAKHLKDTTGVVLEGPADGTGGHMKPPRQVELLDDGDTLSVDGFLLTKPFVEKPVSGEDHNLCVYFPKKDGGGARKLFRKIGNKSSSWEEDLIIPRAISEPESSFVYEKFMKVDNAEDVKAYTVGPSFCHAETRKSPVVDGLVRRNTHGKEIRYITPLTAEEQDVASRIAVSFGQRVCGFDLLRAGGKSYVIDVNGWSFVKDNEEYYNQCSMILKDIFISEKQKRLSNQLSPTSGSSEVASPATSEGTFSPVMKPDNSKDTSHRSTLGILIAKSPSMAKIHGHHFLHKKTPDGMSPELPSAPTPRGTPPGVDSLAGHISSIPTTNPLPPPAVALVTASAPATVPSTAPASPAIVTESHEDAVAAPAPKHTWKLKGMVSVIRHADRTPKQKYKFTFHTKPFIELLRGHEEEVLLTGEAALDSVIVAAEQAMREGIEDREKLRTLRNVLAKKGGWAGTKVQIKPMFRKRKPEEQVIGTVQTIAEEAANRPPVHLPESPAGESADEEKTRRSPQRTDSLSGTTLSRITAAEKSLVLDKLQLIVKWGGEPTHSARYQSQELGDSMRNDLLLMNREVLDEVHVFSSSERRVTTSAQIFAASFTDQKDLPSDFITIRKDLLDDSNAAKDEMDKVKKKLKTLLRQGEEAPSQFAWPIDMPEPSMVQKYLVQLMKFHRKVMRQNYNKLYGGASTSLNAIANPGDKEKGKENAPASMGSAMSQATATSSIQARWCCGEDAELFKERWEKLFAEFCDSEKVDPSKISELYDTMKFDALHNRQFLEWVFTPSKGVLEEEEEEAADSKAEKKTSPDSKSSSESKTSDKANKEKEKRDGNTDDPQGDKITANIERSETSKSLHRRMFRRRSVMPGAKPPEEAPESYFHLFTGSSQTKAKTDARLEKLRELYQLAKVLFDFICPQEYGMADEEKLEIGLLTSLPLLQEIVQDLEEMQASDEAKSFIYFTKESHIYTLLNCILEGGIETKIKRSAIPELDYLSQICFELYESENKTPKDAPPSDAAKYAYSIRITISPGCHTFDPLDVQLDSKHCISCAPRRSLTLHQDWKEVIETLRAKFHQVKLPKSFLAVNLSETHTFHKKDELEDKLSDGATTAGSAFAPSRTEKVLENGGSDTST